MVVGARREEGVRPPQVKAIRARLEAQADPARAAGEKKYLKSDLEFIGCKVPVIRKLCRELRKEQPELERAALVELVDALWATRTHELRSVGIGLLAEYAPLLRAGDIRLVEGLIAKANTWAHVDWLAVTVAGDLVRRFASARKRLDKWAVHEVMWLRRASMLALLEDLRAGGGDFDAFARYAVPLLPEKEFFIRKAIGWVLREVSKKRPALTRGFVREHEAAMAGLTRREALKRVGP